MTILHFAGFLRVQLSDTDSIRLLLALMKWTARFTKRWHSKNGFEHGENPRNARLSYRKHP
ncbi:hypothetical protein ALC57_01271 [Trachymyrmex cornetzi]|uniref:Uncharacterized protein n=1 Tax=Trachymyrmex cornetzi TaxID=471704 RepID=A0A151JPY5_9HYME|nr:hypothetical protein ALC57_01271 [Trachymyrmex cornetzi]